MMINTKLLPLLMLVLPLVALAQKQDGVAEIRDLNVSGRADGLNVEVTLDRAVTPKVSTASNPDRLILDLQGSSGPTKQKRFSVNQDGVKDVRLALNTAQPPVTRLVVDLDAPHAYAVAVRGNTIVLTIFRDAAQVSRPPTAAASTSLLTRLLHNPGKDLKHKPIPEAISTSSTKLPASLRTEFKVKYVAQGAAYLNGGRSSGLVAGMNLLIREAQGSTTSRDSAQPVVAAELRIISVAQNSAVAEIHAAKRDVKPGDTAYLSQTDAERLVAERSLSTADPSRISALVKGSQPEESSDSGSPVPVSPPGRVHVRVGLDYSGIHSSGSTAGRSSERGLAVQADLTRIAGTHWNLQGYWRGRVTRNTQPDEPTLNDYLNKTYLMQLYYDNPDSPWVAGVGRLYLPWAASLDTIDGGYVGHRLGHRALLGGFAGSTPDPTSWHYSPERRIAGSFVNFQGGNYDSFHFSSTSGLAFNSIKWRLDRPYLFFENGISYSSYLSVYHSIILDSPTGLSTNGITPGAGISRSYLSLHLQPHRRVWFDVYHNYFRDVPTAATQLIATGLVDKLLYQGINAGVHVEPIRHVIVYTTLGHSDKSGDSRRTLNQMYGVTWTEIWRTGVRLDAHYSKFDSPFATGNYKVLTFSRQITDRMLWQTQVGRQNLASPFTANSRAMFWDTSFDTNLGRHSFIQTGYTIQHGNQLNYNQWYIGLGYRLDVKQPLSN
jgi:hypothetical protein